MEEHIEHSHDAESIENFIEKELQPHLEIDQGGFRRKIFRRGEITFSFKGREEMPVYDAASSSHTHLIGKSPRHVTALERETYLIQFEKQEIPPDAKEHYIANKSVLGVIELALKLGAVDLTLLDLQKELEQGKYSERALSLIDALIACNAIDTSGELSDGTSTNAEAIVLLSLLGDAQAKQIVQKRLDQFHQQEEKIKMESKTESRENTAKPFDPKELACVHATRYMPQMNEAGQYQIQTTSDATDNVSFRNTIHFTLNHKVGAHSGGSWSEAGIVLISPFEKMMEQNGKPAVLNTVDTFWAQNPGTPITLPQETLLVVPGVEDVIGLYERKGNKIFVKSKNFTQSDITSLVDLQLMDNYDQKVEFLAKRLFDMCRGTFRSFDEAADALKKMLNQNGEMVFHSDDVQNALASLVNEESVKYGIREAGFENFSGALEASVTARTDKLAEFLGVGDIAHSGTMHSKLELALYDKVVNASRDLFSGEALPFDWKKLQSSPNGLAFALLDPPTRRSFYESGYITTREN